LEVSIAQTNLALANARQQLVNLQRAVPYSVEEEIKAYTLVNELEAGLAYAKQVLEERF
jgi:hypothetical protein